MSNFPKILVLGSQGMLGRIICIYLLQKFPNSVLPDAQKIYAGSDIEQIFKVNNDIAYVINCIGALRNASQVELELLNKNVPHMIASISKKFKINVIHVSTDAVFPATAGIVTETDKSFPEDLYGQSKLFGEVQVNNFLSFRTSLLGFSPRKHKGLLEWVLNEKSDEIPGFINQLWSGCTVLQFAMLCEKIISRNAFEQLRKTSSVFHFAPIQPVSKYQLIKDFVKIMKLKKTVKKTYDSEITRVLKTNFKNDLWLNEFTANHVRALKELVEYERMQFI